jgi:NDP-sugar pyrophosphorylase family protein
VEKPVLVIMAAGLGSRYGGLKQIDPIDNEGHALIEYSLYDAYRAGFEIVIFVITKEIEKEFKKVISDRISKHLTVKYAYQDINNIPEGFSVPYGRKKPWGTAHAVLSAKEHVKGPFVVINADDFYGKSAFELIFNFLSDNKNEADHAMVGYRIEDTLAENGQVARGICKINRNGNLTEITERINIEKRPGGAIFTEDGVNFTFVPEGTTVSMNIWGFSLEIMDEIENRFTAFLKKNLYKDPLNCEYFLPSVIGTLIKEKIIEVMVLTAADKWYGVTYKSDITTIREALTKMKNKGKYPEYF